MQRRDEIQGIGGKHNNMDGSDRRDRRIGGGGVSKPMTGEGVVCSLYDTQSLFYQWLSLQY